VASDCTIAEVELLLRQAPHNMCSHSSEIALVLKGGCPLCLHLFFVLSPCV
jgi:hypothetical protein